jgi:hypothetical protein
MVAVEDAITERLNVCGLSGECVSKRDGDVVPIICFDCGVLAVECVLRDCARVRAKLLDVSGSIHCLIGQCGYD